MRFRLLGPVEIGPRDHPVRLAGARVTKMLAALLVDAHRTVPVSRLVDVLWDDAPPASAIKVVRNCVSALRIATTAADLPATVTATANGYRLNVSPEELDVAAFYQALHAAILGFAHPRTRKKLRWESPLPADLVELSAALSKG